MTRPMRCLLRLTSILSARLWENFDGAAFAPLAPEGKERFCTTVKAGKALPS